MHYTTGMLSASIFCQVTFSRDKLATLSGTENLFPHENGVKKCGRRPHRRERERERENCVKYLQPPPAIYDFLTPSPPWLFQTLGHTRPTHSTRKTEHAATHPWAARSAQVAEQFARHLVSRRVANVARATCWTAGPQPGLHIVQHRPCHAMFLC